MGYLLRGVSGATVRVLDGLVTFWVLLWIIVAALIGWAVWQLTGLTDTVTDSGNALDSAGQAIASFGDIPLVGDVPRQLGAQIRGTAEDIRTSGMNAEATVKRVAILLGLVVLLMPTLPLLLAYLPPRVGRARELRALKQSMSRADEGALDGYLAQQAVQSLPFDQLRKVTPDPWSDLASGRVRALADAQLRHLGMRRPASGSVGARAAGERPPGR
jgi:hypothetical protein